MMSALFKISMICFVGLTLSQDNKKVTVSEDTLEKAIEMMQNNDVWMNSLKMMMDTNNSRGFKVESHRVIEYSDPNNPTTQESNQQSQSMNMMMVQEDVTPAMPLSQRTWFPMFSNRPSHIPGTNVVVGDVGLCKTQFKYESLHTAALMRKPNAPKYPLAHRIPVAVGRCRQSFPPSQNGVSGGKCVLAAQTHVAWLVVRAEEAHEFETCVDIPGVTALRKCADWIVFGGRCVYDMEM